MTDHVEVTTPLEIAARIAGEDTNLAKLLVLAVRRDGSSFSLDNGLTADEAKTMAVHFETWVDGKDREGSEEVNE